MPLPELTLTAVNAGWPPNPLASPDAYRGVTLRRVLAYLVDLWCIGLILVILYLVIGLLTVMSFGLLWPLHFLIIPVAVALAYHSLQMAGPAAATLGMRFFDLRVYSVLRGRPSLTQAVIHTICLYATLGVSGGLLLLVALFNPHRRTLHDFLAGMVVLRKSAV